MGLKLCFLKLSVSTIFAGNELTGLQNCKQCLRILIFTVVVSWNYNPHHVRNFVSEKEIRMVTSLGQIVDVFKHTYSNSSVQICDKECYFRFMGDRLLNAVGLSSAEVVDKRLNYIDSPVKHLSSQYYDLNAQVLSGAVAEVNYSTYLKSADKLIIAKNKVKPIIINDEISGLILDTTLSDTVLNFDFSIFSNRAENTSAILVNEVQADNTIFSELEELVIFLIVMGKVDKEISELLQLVGVFLSRAGVSKFITRKIFPKVDADTRNKLISQVFYLGLINKVPQLILNNQRLFNVTFN